MALDATVRTMDASLLEVLDGLGRRWSPRILWELRGGAIGFNELRVRCDAMSSSVLSQRLRELAGLGVVTLDDFDAWELTRLGERLVEGFGAAVEN